MSEMNLKRLIKYVNIIILFNFLKTKENERKNLTKFIDK